MPESEIVVVAESYNLHDLVLPSSAHVARASWTAIIHAVGPELKAEASAHKILSWCAERLEPFCHHMIFVVPHASAILVRPVLESLMHGPFKLISQRDPLGVGNALQLCQAAVKTPRVIVMEAGTMALTDEAMQACMTFAKQNPETQMILPRLVAEQGNIECGTMFFKSGALFRGLSEAGASTLRGFQGRGSSLQPLIPFLDQLPGAMVVLQIEKSDMYLA